MPVAPAPRIHASCTSTRTRASSTSNTLHPITAHRLSAQLTASHHFANTLPRSSSRRIAPHCIASRPTASHRLRQPVSSRAPSSHNISSRERPRSHARTPKPHQAPHRALNQALHQAFAHFSRRLASASQLLPPRSSRCPAACFINRRRRASLSPASSASAAPATSPARPQQLRYPHPSAVALV